MPRDFFLLFITLQITCFIMFIGNLFGKRLTLLSIAAFYFFHFNAETLLCMFCAGWGNYAQKIVSRSPVPPQGSIYWVPLNPCTCEVMSHSPGPSEKADTMAVVEDQNLRGIGVGVLKETNVGKKGCRTSRLLRKQSTGKRSQRRVKAFFSCCWASEVGSGSKPLHESDSWDECIIDNEEGLFGKSGGFRGVRMFKSTWRGDRGHILKTLWVQLNGQLFT